MHLNFRALRNTTLLASLLLACGEDEDPLDSASASASATNPGTMSATTDPNSGETDGTGTGGPTSGSPTSDPGTTDPTGEGPAGDYCVEVCQGDEDCLLGGQDMGYTCQGGRCVGGANGNCSDDFGCQILFSGWEMSCAAQADCPGQACIDIGRGEGRCAFIPNDVTDCQMLYLGVIQATPIEGGPAIDVCAATDYECIDNLCQNPCEIDEDCAGVPGLPHCNAGTGRCECISDVDCGNSEMAGFNTCKTTFCGCSSDAACSVNLSSADVCNDGWCGCSSVDVCATQIFDGTSPACASG